MRFIGALTGILVTASLTLMFAPAAANAQETTSPTKQVTSSPDDNAYRAEIVILERKVDPANVVEKMASRHPEPADDVTKQLWVEDQNGQRHSDLQLVPRNELYLSSAADRLERSGRFKILAAAGWYQSYPPDYEGEKMRVAVGDWLNKSQQREIEGYIKIDRLRFLHVTVALNHWQPVSSEAASGNNSPGTPAGQTNSPMNRNGTATAQPATAANGVGLPANTALSAPDPQQNKELLTWIRETRRMRSEEIHFLDSPTIGVLVFFKRIEPGDGPTQ